MKDLTQQYRGMDWCDGTILSVFDYSEDDTSSRPALIVYLDGEGDGMSDWAALHALPKRTHKMTLHSVVYKNGCVAVFTNEALADNVIQVAREGNVPRRHVIEIEVPAWEDLEENA